MNAIFEPKNPDKIEMTLTVSATIGEWKAIREFIGTSMASPQWELGTYIDHMVEKAEVHFYPKP